MSEYFDVVDERGIPTGETVERTIAHRDGIRHRTAHIWVAEQTETGVRVLLQKRAENKDSFPGKYDTSAAGHMQAGHEPLESAKRELEEELGICAGEGQLAFVRNYTIDYDAVFHGKPFHDREVVFLYAYTGKVDMGKLVLQKEEVSEVRWFGLEQVLDHIEEKRDVFCVPKDGMLYLKEYFEEK